MISSHRIPPILILCIGPFSKYVTLEWGEEGPKKQQKNGIEKKACSQKVITLTQILLCTFSMTQSLFLLGFSWSSDNITASNKKSTSKKEPTSASEITI